jgi:pimeloyl-ACP methyl ester carboxylesterase
VSELNIRHENTDAGGTPVVLIHGVGDNLTAWDAVLDAWQPARPVIRYDLRGHGDSFRPPRPWSIDDLVTDHVSVLDRLGCTKAHTIGFSLGGLVAQAVAARRGDRVARLVVVGAVAGRTEVEQAAVLLRLADIEEHGPAEVAKRSIGRWYTAEYLAAHPGTLDETVRRMSGLDPGSYRAAYRVLATTDLVRELAAVTAPTLAVTGEHDVGSPPRMAETIAATVADGQAVVIPGGRHDVHKENATALAKEIDHFVR